MKTEAGHTDPGNAPRILLINPWIHDFAAYDFWARPLGLLMLGGILRSHGCHVTVIDCLDRFHPNMPPTDPEARMGRGPYLKTRIAKPAGLDRIPRHFSRYGIRRSWFADALRSMARPDLVLVTSLMTYWYPGVQETIAECRKIHPDVPVVLGGVYATLCTDHARRHSGADEVVAGPGESRILDIVERYTGCRHDMRFDPDDMDTWPYPAFDLLPRRASVAMLTARGCPYACAYCASRVLDPVRRTRTPHRVVDEMIHWQQQGARDIAFYDDALLVDAERHIIPILEAVIDRDLDLRFHTPNALHIRHITARVARLMKAAGFETIRLGLETIDFSHRSGLDRKVTAEEFAAAVSHLREAGFQDRQMGAYLLAGLPGQDLDDLESAVAAVRDSGITPVPAYYSPIPHTALWEAAQAASPYDLAADPIYTNNAILPCSSERFSWDRISRLKAAAHPDT